MHQQSARIQTLCDTHVHIYDCFDLDTLLANASRNFEVAAERAGASDYAAVMMLSESSNDHWFDRLARAATNGDQLGTGWLFSKTSEPESIRAHKDNSHPLMIIAGRQIVSEEKLEILALATLFKCPDGQPAEEIVDEIAAAGGIAVAPWGVGKWWGSRGRALTSLLDRYSPQQMALGDNSGRPWFMRNPTHFKIARQQSRHILPGTDPLPFAKEANRPGSVGCILDHVLDTDFPATDIKRQLLSNAVSVTPYMRYESLLPFLGNQIGMQLRKKLS